jgi:hypothetical protein
VSKSIDSASHKFLDTVFVCQSINTNRSQGLGGERILVTTVGLLVCDGRVLFVLIQIAEENLEVDRVIIMELDDAGLCFLVK